VKVTLYTTPVCPWCVRVKDFLKKNKLKFEEVDVTTGAEKAQEMVKKSGQMGVPVTVIANGSGSEAVIVGFDEGKLKKHLHLN